MSDDAPTTVLAAYTGPEPDHDGVERAAAPEGDRGGLAAELVAMAPRRLWNRATIYLGAAALLAAGFVGGIQVQQRYGAPAGGAGAVGGGARAGGLAFPGGGATAFPGSGNSGGVRTGGGADESDGGATTGTVKLVNGATVYVQTAAGEVVVVRLSGSTSVRVAKAGTAKDLTAGDPVTVVGQSASDGSVTASSVTKQVR